MILLDFVFSRDTELGDDFVELHFERAVMSDITYEETMTDNLKI